MKWKFIIADYFTFTRRERIGLLVLVSLIIVIFLLPVMVSDKSSSLAMPADTAWMAAARRLEVKEAQKDDRAFDEQPGNKNNDYDYQYDRPVNAYTPRGSLFYFDPNTIGESGWKKLGLKDKTIHTIRNYLAKGGHFYKPEDLQKVYGLHPDEYSRLEPFIKIATKKNGDKPAEYARKENEPKHFSYSIIDINTADTTAFISLPGIGSKLAARIVNFRDKLGGFYSMEQVGETYGLADSSFQKIKQYLKLENTSIKKININTATVDELKAHPYIRYNLANPIIAYRKEHGPFSKLEDIKKVMAVTDDLYKKIVPYITID